MYRHILCIACDVRKCQFNGGHGGSKHRAAFPWQLIRKVLTDGHDTQRILNPLVNSAIPTVLSHRGYEPLP